MKSGAERAKAVNQIAESVIKVLIGWQGSQLGLTITLYRSKAIAVMLIVDTNIEVAWSPATNLHVASP